MSSQQGLEGGDATGPAVERPELRFGFMALTDCAPLVIAKERGFFRKHGVHVELERQASWANVRDKVCHGLLDGAPMLAPMPLASTLGLAGLATPMIVPIAMSLGGNAITISRALHERMLELSPRGLDAPGVAAAALREVIRARRDAGEPALRLATVHPHSSHLHQLCHWMAMAGVDPHRDVNLSVIPPPSMVEALSHGQIDGYCVGEPWNQQALDSGVGVPIVASDEIWGSPLEKVFAVTEEWAERHPATLRAVVRALLEAAAWVDRSENRLETVHVIAGESHVGANVETVSASMRAPEKRTLRGRARTHHIFHRHAATHPWISQGLWYLTQMVRWGQIEKPIDMRAVARRVFRPEWHREAALALGLPVPATGWKTEGEHADEWLLAGESEAIRMGPDAFMDGHVFRPDEVIGYLESFEVSDLRVRLDDLALFDSDVEEVPEVGV